MGFGADTRLERRGVSGLVTARLRSCCEITHTVKQEVRFTDKRLGRPDEIIVAPHRSTFLSDRRRGSFSPVTTQASFKILLKPVEHLIRVHSMTPRNLRYRTSAAQSRPRQRGLIG